MSHGGLSDERLASASSRAAPEECEEGNAVKVSRMRALRGVNCQQRPAACSTDGANSGRRRSRAKAHTTQAP